MPRVRPAGGRPVSDVYDAAAYYDLAFGYRDFDREVEFMCEALHRFSRRQPRRVLELACGSAPHLAAWHARRCEYVGMDVSRQMLRAARARGLPATLVRADMRRFAPGDLRIDVAYVMLGSLYLQSNEEFLRHLDGLQEALRPGGLYVLDGVAWFHALDDGAQSWTMRRGGVVVRTQFHAELVNGMAQTYAQVVRLDVRDRGRRFTLESRPVTKLFFPQELELLVRHHGGFEVKGWYYNFDLGRPVRPARRQGREVLVLRRLLHPRRRPS
jgi:SAM-dependent methyltransferase